MINLERFISHPPCSAETAGCENNVELRIDRELPNLAEVSISDCDIDDGTVTAVSRGCPNLRKLDISGSSQVR